MKVYVCGLGGYDGSQNVFLTRSKKKANDWKAIAEKLLHMDDMLRKMEHRRDTQIQDMFPQKIDKYWENGKMTPEWERRYNDIQNVEKNDQVLKTINEARDIMEDIADHYKVSLFYESAYVEEWKVESS